MSKSRLILLPDQGTGKRRFDTREGQRHNETRLCNPFLSTSDLECTRRMGGGGGWRVRTGRRSFGFDSTMILVEEWLFRGGENKASLVLILVSICCM